MSESSATTNKRDKCGSEEKHLQKASAGAEKQTGEERGSIGDHKGGELNQELKLVFSGS